MASSTIGTAQDYATVTLWESNEQRDLVTATEIEEGQCLDEVFTEAVTISGWTTSSSYYPKLTAQGGTGFDGVAGNGPRVTHASADVIYSVDGGENWVEVGGMGVDNYGGYPSFTIKTKAGEVDDIIVFASNYDDNSNEVAISRYDYSDGLEKHGGPYPAGYGTRRGRGLWPA